MQFPSEENNYQMSHVGLLGQNYQRLLHKPLIAKPCGGKTLAKALFEAPFAVVSHGTEDDPIFNYANKKALELFAMDWAEFTATPSRLSAEAVNQEKRQHSLDQVARHGFIDNYQGVRISKQGQRFLIKNTVIWNLIDDDGAYRGQAACFDGWEFL